MDANRNDFPTKDNRNISEDNFKFPEGLCVALINKRVLFLIYFILLDILLPDFTELFSEGEQKFLF